MAAQACRKGGKASLRLFLLLVGMPIYPMWGVLGVAKVAVAAVIREEGGGAKLVFVQWEV